MARLVCYAFDNNEFLFISVREPSPSRSDDLSHLRNVHNSCKRDFCLYCVLRLVNFVAGKFVQIRHVENAYKMVAQKSIHSLRLETRTRVGVFKQTSRVHRFNRERIEITLLRCSVQLIDF